jgi:hypothetical protein
VYLCLEGSLKADAVLSAGGVSISSTSVTTWECPDLKNFLPVLREAPAVHVVPDSDYYSSPRFDGSFNPMVLWQTRKAAQWLRTRGVNAEIRVPWLGMEAGKVGVDDYLAKGYLLSGLTTQEPYRHPHVVGGHPLSKSQTRILGWLLDQQGAYGAFYPGEVAKAVGVDRKTVYRAYKYFEELGIMRVWKGKVVKTQTGFVQAPVAYYIDEPWDMDYGSWLRRIPIPPGRG